MARVIVTAANSFIGRRMCKALAEQGNRVYAVVRNQCTIDTAFAACENIFVICSDMCEYGKLWEKIPEACDIGISLAWDGTRGKDRDDFLKQKNNYIHSLECVQSFIKKGCGIIMTAGSQAEYGPRTGLEKVKETDLCAPNTEYGNYKLKFYQDALKICESANVRLIEPRFFSLYGPDDSDKTMIISMIRKMLRNQPCELTQCIQMWDFLYIDDAIRALVKLLQCKNAQGIYNFGSGVSRQLREYIEIMHDATESNSELLYGKVPYPETGIVHTNPSIERLSQTINWKPCVTFEEGIRKVIDMQRNFEEYKR